MEAKVVTVCACPLTSDSPAEPVGSFVMPSHRPLSTTESLRLANRPTSVPPARHWARTLAIEKWTLPHEVADDVELVVGELTGNVVKHVPRVIHGHEREFHLLLKPTGGPGSVRLEAHDAADLGKLITVAAHSPDGEGGRGLLLVDTVAQSWGVDPRAPLGKVVWAVVGRSA